MAQQTRVGGLPGFAISAENLDVVLRELRALEPNLRKELVAEMKAGVKPIGSALASKIPTNAPLSGFAPGNNASSPYVWRKPSMIVKTPFAKKAKKPGFYPVVSIQFNDRRPNAGLSILELAGTRNIGRAKGGLTPQGAAMIRNLPPMRNGLGRFVIPEFTSKQAEATRIAVQILEKFAQKVGRRLKEK
jgi:hypothetical protein